jgi:benzaldehyde dehydrogenase (NAD)
MAALGSIGKANAQDVADAASAARAAQPAWAATDYKERAAMFRKAAAFIDQHQDELCNWIEAKAGERYQFPGQRTRTREAVCAHFHVVDLYRSCRCKRIFPLCTRM